MGKNIVSGFKKKKKLGFFLPIFRDLWCLGGEQFINDFFWAPKHFCFNGADFLFSFFSGGVGCGALLETFIFFF